MRAGGAGQGLTIDADNVGPTARTPKTAIAKQDPDCHGEHGGSDDDRADEYELHRSYSTNTESLFDSSSNSLNAVVIRPENTSLLSRIRK